MLVGECDVEIKVGNAQDSIDQIGAELDRARQTFNHVTFLGVALQQAPTRKRTKTACVSNCKCNEQVQHLQFLVEHLRFFELA